MVELTKALFKVLYASSGHKNKFDQRIWRCMIHLILPFYILQEPPFVSLKQLILLLVTTFHSANCRPIRTLSKFKENLANFHIIDIKTENIPCSSNNLPKWSLRCFLTIMNVTGSQLCMFLTNHIASYNIYARWESTIFHVTI